MGFDMESLLEATLGAIGDLVSTTVLYPLDIKPKFEFTISRSTGSSTASQPLLFT
ncbi:hypothetical protein CIPAW_02G094200 [Carya illinoinensis]|uniref:Uncharacterized protein n=1 Tax=Carya illinoinensis TaxID=32201 RepID=A0A8T1RC58_CARIL|nr:hypothetical protein CIPAW_02G094200 [Carya illinoinensis]KAG6664457.1 hypothetical protein CIPAW_02G094200 [Carya illinoinensis]